jgi:diaminopimelate epimerase
MRTVIPFRKMNGLGNEILVVDLRGSKHVLTPELARGIAERPGSRFDQMMVLHDPTDAGTDAYVRIYNSDGSQAEACGNGMRCVGWTVAQDTGRKELKFETKAGLVDVTVGSPDLITVDMGRPRFGWQEIPLSGPAVDTTAVDVPIEPIPHPALPAASVVNIGNPHAVFWVDDPDSYDLAGIGPKLEAHPLFPERANISLARVSSPSAIGLRVWERGAGLTRACGSAACAAAVCGHRKGLTGRRVTVTLPGGPLEIEWRADDRIFMTGPVEFEYDGALELVETA